MTCSDWSMSVDVFTQHARLLVWHVNLFKNQLKRIQPVGPSKDYLIHLKQSVFQFQVSVRLADKYCPFVCYLPSSLRREVLEALSYDVSTEFGKAIVRYDNLVNDTFLFVE